MYFKCWTQSILSHAKAARIDLRCAFGELLVVVVAAVVVVEVVVVVVVVVEESY